VKFGILMFYINNNNYLSFFVESSKIQSSNEMFECQLIDPISYKIYINENHEIINYDNNQNNLIENLKIKLPNSFVNDNFCDCKNGIDEYKTSACSGIINIKNMDDNNDNNNNDNEYKEQVEIQSMFTCNNSPFSPIRIPTSRIDDGVCDCCDGSDEQWAEYNQNNFKIHVDKESNVLSSLFKFNSDSENDKISLYKSSLNPIICPNTCQIEADRLAKIENESKQIYNEGI